MANALVTLIDEQVIVSVAGSELLAPLVARATEAAEEAEEHADRAEVAAGVAVTGLNHQIYDDLAEAESETAVDGYFILDTGGGTFQYRQNTSPDSVVLFTYIGQPLGYTSATVNGELVAVPYYRTVTDLFIFIGQSNAEGRGDSAQSPDASLHFEVEADGDIIPLVDPVGGATTGSMGPAWAIQWLASTGRRVAIMEAATGGSSLLAAADGGSGNWSSTGALRAAAVTLAETAINAIQTDGDHLIGNIHFVWVQGEADAQSLDAGDPGVGGAEYQAELEALATYLQTEIPRARRMFIVRLGHRNNRDEAAAWWEIRDAQEAAADGSTFMQIVYRGATSFQADAMDLMADQLHYNQTALNLVGTAAAIEAAASTPSEIPDAPAVLDTESFIDTDPSTLALGRTDSHTTPALTKAIVVGIATIRATSSVVITPSSVTFDGVALTSITDAIGGNTGVANTTSVGRAVCSWWMLTETEYGDTLAGVTADLVVTLPSAQASIISSFVYDLDIEPLVEAAPYVNLNDPNEGTLYTSGFAGALGDGLSTGAPTLALGLAATVGDGAAALTHTWAGLNEDFDGGGSTGTRAAQASTASGTFLDEVLQEAITVTSSAMTGGALLVVALRGRVAGEETA